MKQKLTFLKFGHGPRPSGVGNVTEVDITSLPLGKIMLLQLLVVEMEIIVIVHTLVGFFTLRGRNNEFIFSFAYWIVVVCGYRRQRVAAPAAFQRARAPYSFVSTGRHRGGHLKKQSDLNIQSHLRTLNS